MWRKIEKKIQEREKYDLQRDRQKQTEMMAAVLTETGVLTSFICFSIFT